MTTDSHVLSTESRQQEAADNAPRTGGAATWPRIFLPALLTSLLLWASYFPVGWGWLAWFALVPLLSLVRSPGRPRLIYLASLLSGIALYWPVLQWMRLADDRMYATWAILATYGSFYVPVTIWLLRRFDRVGVPLVFTVPITWTALEFFRANLGGGFAWYLLGHPQHDIPGGYAWYFLGHSQHAYLPLIQISDLCGAYGVTFLVAAGNALIFELCYRWSGFRRLLGLPAETPARLGWLSPAFCLLVLAGAIAYGYVRLGQQEDSPGPVLALLQGNLDQRIKNEAGASDEKAAKAQETILEHYEKLCRDAVTGEQPALVVWPESGYPAEWYELRPGFPEELLEEKLRDEFNSVPGRAGTVSDYWIFCMNRDILGDTMRWKTPMLLGLNTSVKENAKEYSRYNTALFLPGKPSIPLSRRYDKIHRVPFGEYIPFRQTLPFMNAFAPYEYDYTVKPGEQFTRFPLGGYNFGVLICFEDTDPNLARQYGRATEDGPPVDFIVNISNDGWFIGSAEHDEHLAICRFRAVEARRSVARAVNMGVSAVIDGSGRVVALPGADWSSSKAIAGVVKASVPIDSRISYYARLGDVFAWSCFVLLLAGVVLARFRKASAIQGPTL